MVRKRLYAKQTASVEYEQIDLFSLLEEEQRQADRTAEQVRGYEITVGHAAVQRKTISKKGTMMDEMTWTDPQLKARYERNLKAMEQRRAAHPELFNKWALPYKVFTRSSLHGIQNMRINWLMDNHPQRFREMMMANVLEEHLRDIERRTRERQAQIMDQLMESRHLLNRTDCLKAAPQMTDLDRLNGMNEAQAESMSMAIHEIVESF